MLSGARGAWIRAGQSFLRLCWLLYVLTPFVGAPGETEQGWRGATATCGFKKDSGTGARGVDENASQRRVNDRRSPLTRRSSSSRHVNGESFSPFVHGHVSSYRVAPKVSWSQIVERIITTKRARNDVVARRRARSATQMTDVSVPLETELCQLHCSTASPLPTHGGIPRRGHEGGGHRGAPPGR